MTKTESDIPFKKKTAVPDKVLTLILEEARDIIVLLRGDYSLAYANAAARAAYQYSRQEITKLSIWELRAPESVAGIHEQLTKAWQHGLLFRTTHMRKNRERFVVEVNSKKFEYEGETFIISIIRDVTEVLEKTELLQKREQQNQSLNEDLVAAHEELLASEEELRQQFEELVVLDQQVHHKNFLLESLHTITLTLMNDTNFESILQRVLLAAAKLVDTPHGFIYRLDFTRENFVQSHGVGNHSYCNGLTFPTGYGIAGKVFRSSQTVLANHYRTYQQGTPPPDCLEKRFQEHGLSFGEISALLLVPLKNKGRVVGIIGLSHYGSNRNFTQDEVSILMQFADMASIVVNNASLFLSHQTELKERQKTEEELRKSQATNQALLNAIPDPLFIFDERGRLLYFKAQPDQVHAATEPAIGRTIGELFPPEVALQVRQHISAVLTTNSAQIFEYEINNYNTSHYFEIRFVPFSPTEVLAIQRNITERHRLEKQLKYNSTHDSLTALYNRTHFEEHMRYPLQKPGLSVGMLICDVDGLKIINDALGHSAGDDVLRQISVILRSSFQRCDILARIGGDELAVILYDTTLQKLEDACKIIRERLEIYNERNTMFPVSISIGYALSKSYPVNMNALFKEADTNMYREKLHQKHSVKNSIVQALVKALEARDYLTEGHGERLQELVELFAKNLGLPEHQIADLRLLAHFHDIGKVGIPDQILFKPGALSEDEWTVMRQHADIGYRIANSVPDLVPIAPWILSHHERWDGKGYPQGLAGKNIPLPCRILALVDTYDAMTNDRPYRKAASSQDAVLELKKFSGSQFDPELAFRFIELLIRQNGD
jgi:diguanylate cyclase (GGDEF)-like protein/PAS domain S-box-containing protein